MEALKNIAKKELKLGVFALALFALMVSTHGDAVLADKVEIKIGIQDYFCHNMTLGNWDTARQTMAHFAYFAKRRYPHNSLSDVVNSIYCSSGLNPLQHTAYRGERAALRLMVKEYNVDVNVLGWGGYTVRDYVQNQIYLAKSESIKKRFQVFLSFLRQELGAKHSAKWLQESQ